MATLDIRLPERFSFSTEVPVRIGDINRGQHVGHVALISIIEEARAQFWVRCGYAEQERSEQGIGFIIAGLAVSYRRQATYGPALRVEIGVNEFTFKGYDILYRVSESLANHEIARAKTAIVVFDYRSQKSIALPADLRAKLGADYLR